MASITEIDGSVLEGGGQILRLAMSLSSLLKKPIKVTNIRANRSKGGGLRPQHLKGLEMAAAMCDGTLTGAAVSEKEITYHPRNLKADRYEVDTQTAGSIALLMQVSIPIALFASSPTYLVLKGGTNADMAPPVDYTINVFLPVLKKFGGDCVCHIRRRGFYPRGGGVVDVEIRPITTLSPVTMTSFGRLTRIWGRSYVAGVLPVKVAYEMADAARKVLDQLRLGTVPVDIERVHESSEKAVGNGCGIVLFAETNTGCILGASALGKRGVPAHDVGTEAAEELAAFIKGQYCVDDHMQDQMIVLMALANGKSAVKCGPPTLHAKTAIYIAEMLTDAKFKVEEKSDHCIIECDGIGFKLNSN